MINVVLPMAGKSQFFDSPEYFFPRPFIEIHGKSIIELVINNLKEVGDDVNFIFIVNETDCLKYHIDDTLKLLTSENCNILRLKGDTKGAACSSMMAIELINSETPLIVANSDQIFEKNVVRDTIRLFRDKNVDAGVICFESVHPRWSYARVDQMGKIVEATEKRPISKNAIAGFYYFKQGRDFIHSVKESIKKDSNIGGLYYIAPVLNELILENRILSIQKIDNSKYFTLYSPQKIKEYEQMLGNQSTRR